MKRSNNDNNQRKIYEYIIYNIKRYINTKQYKKQAMTKVYVQYIHVRVAARPSFTANQIDEMLNSDDMSDDADFWHVDEVMFPGSDD